jgi:hypothetical protein
MAIETPAMASEKKAHIVGSARRQRLVAPSGDWGAAAQLAAGRGLNDDQPISRPVSRACSAVASAAAAAWLRARVGASVCERARAFSARAR